MAHTLKKGNFTLLLESNSQITILLKYNSRSSFPSGKWSGRNDVDSIPFRHKLHRIDIVSTSFDHPFLTGLKSVIFTPLRSVT